MSSVAVPRVTVHRGKSHRPFQLVPPNEWGWWPGARLDLKSGVGGFVFGWSRQRLRPWSSSDDPKPRDSAYDRMRSAYRAAAAVRERVLTGGLRVMFTFTHRENVLDLSVSRACVTRFLRLMRRRFPKFKWVGAAERQKRGAWHWHLAVNGFYDINVVRELWMRACGEALFGNVNVHAWDSAPRAGRYLSKYLSKTFLEEEDRPRYGHHYVVARGLQMDVSRYLLLGTSQSDLLEFMKEQASALGFTARSWSSDGSGNFGRGWGDG